MQIAAVYMLSTLYAIVRPSDGCIIEQESLANAR